MGLFSKSVPLEKQLEKLAELGIRADIELDDPELFRVSTQEEMEATPHKLLAEALGDDFNDDRDHPFSNCLWMLDFECIEDTDDYARLIRRLDHMTGGALDAREVEDEVEIDDEIMWVRFESKLGPIRWEPRIRDDWFDPQVLVDYDALLEQAGSELQLYINQHDYQQCGYIAAFTPKQAKRFTKLTKIPLESLR